MRVLLMAAAIVVPLALAHAQPKVGVLTFTPVPDVYKEAFRKGLRDQGYAEGKNILVEWRSGDGKVERANQLAAELVQAKVNVLVASLTPAVTAARKATRVIPIVMAPAGDPVATGFVASLAHPGGNITGTTNLAVDVGSKLLGLLRELRPNISRVAVLFDERSALAKPFADEVEAAAAKIGMRVVRVDMNGPSDAAQAMRAVQKEGAQAIVVTPLLVSKELADLARDHRVMSITSGISSRTLPRVGGLIGYGPDPIEPFQRAATYVAKILRGANPGDLPVEQATTFELIINAKTAKAIGLTVPKDMLVRANEVIE